MVAPKLLFALVGAGAVVVGLLAWGLMPTPAVHLPPPMTLVAGDAEGDASASAADILQVGAANDAQAIQLFVTVAGSGFDGPVLYRATFTLDGTAYEATATCRGANSADCDPPVLSPGGPLTAEWVGYTLRFTIPRTSLGQPDNGALLDGLRASTMDAREANPTGAGTLDDAAPGVYIVQDMPPVLEPVAPASVPEGETLRIQLAASDADGDAINFTAPDLPRGAVLESNGTFTWTPAHDQAGSHTVTFTASDGTLEAKRRVTIRVLDVNRPPVLEAVSTLVGNESQAIALQVPASDPDGDALSYEADGLPKGARLDPATGQFSWTPGFDQAGTHNVTLRASDGRLSATGTLTLRIANVNRAPIVAPQANRTLAERATLTMRHNATDPDGDAVTRTVEGLPTGATYNSTSGIVSWRPTCAQHGTYRIVLVASDGNAQTRLGVPVIVTDINCAPKLGNLANKTLNEDATLSFTVTATDEDGDAITRAATGLPSGAKFNRTTGAFSWRPTCTQHGVYRITFTAADGKATTRQEITVTVVDVNCAPAVKPIGNKTVAENARLAFTAEATDGEGGTLTRTITGLPTGATFNGATGAFAWTPTCRQNGSYPISITTSDGSKSTRQDFTIRVTDVNCVPTMTAIANRTTAQQATTSFTVTATDPDGDNVTRTATGLPTGATFNTASGAFSWRPTCTQQGAFTITFSASDGVNTARQTVTITVTDIDCPPTFGSLPDRNATVGSEVRFTVTATDPEGNAVTISVGTMPTGATFNATSREFRWTPSSGQTGAVQVSFTASDGAVAATRTVTITVS